ncbi:MAG: tyrosine-type recombinase/integrase [Thermacetogeniaceae bacterium]
MRGHIRKRAKDSWTVVVELPRDPVTGKRRQKWVTVKGTKKDAERKLAELLVQADRGLLPKASPKMTLGEFLDYFLDTARGKRENTYYGYAAALQFFGDAIGRSVKLADIDTAVVQAAVNALSKGHKNSTVQVYFTKFKTAMKHAVDAGFLAKNPCEGVILNKPERGEKAVWDDDQANKFIRYCKRVRDKYAVLFVFLLKTGMRVGEALALRWSDVDFEAGEVHVTRTVSGRGYNPPKSKNGIRKVQLDAGTLDMLSKYRIQQNKEKLLHGGGWNPENLVFCRENGERMSYATIRRVFMRMVKKAGVPLITIHGLRHTHATFLLKHGLPVNLVAERLGDDSKTVMTTYAHVLPSMQREAVKAIERVYD